MMMGRRPSLWLRKFGSWPVVVLALCVTAIAGASEVPSPLRTSVSHHVATIRGARVPYTTIVAANVVPDTKGAPGATVFTIAYIRDNVTDRTTRPLLFAFNGGPGASSSPLHMQALGPVIRKSGNLTTRDASGLEANTVSLLDCADLVFIDPVSTGFSRPFPNVDPKQWYDTRFDATTVAGVIAAWLKQNQREASPRYLAGESYGTTRATLIVRYAPHLHFDGVLLISGGPGGGARSEDERAIEHVPSMAAGAWFHHKVARRGLDVGAFYREAAQFARGDYAAALAKANSLSAAEKDKVAHCLSAYIGLPADLILAKNLRVDRNTYLFNLLKDRGLRTGLLDLRVTGPLLPNQEGAIDDPALGAIKPGTHSSTPVNPASIGALPSPTVGRYIVDQLDFMTTETYYGVNFLANSQWTFEPDDGSARIMSAAMKSDPHLRLFLTSGYFDFGSSDAGAYLEAGVPAARLTFLPLPGPHEVYAGAQNRAAFNAALRHFMSGS